MENALQYLKEFQQLLVDYRVSKDSKKTLEQTKLVLMLAPSAGGRNTVIRELLKTGEYHFIISDTTRKPRVNDGVAEQNGVEYWFRSEHDVLVDLKAGNYLEAELIHNQQISGISIRELERAHQENRIAITDVDMGGLQNIVQAKPDAIAVLLLPPSFEEWQKRMLKRGSMSPAEHRRRLDTAVKIFTFSLEHDFMTFVINDNFVHTAQQLHALVIGAQASSDSVGKKLAQSLREETLAYLEASPHR